ncbi:MAG: hypothetical protein HGB08_01620 [Candidatus Moranbacteria bacterium]|nr:hypothetical protein [Candidatus Moranbacteria bacterium]
MNLTAMLSTLGLSASMAQDATLFLVVLLLSFVFGVSIGRAKLITILANIYVAFSIFSVIPDKLIADYVYDVITFLALIVGLTLFSGKLIEVPFHISGSGFLWRVFALSFLEVVMTLSIIIDMVPKKEALSYISASSYGYLASSNMMLVWMVAPLVFLALIHNKVNR